MKCGSIIIKNIPKIDLNATLDLTLAFEKVSFKILGVVIFIDTDLARGVICKESYLS